MSNLLALDLGTETGFALRSDDQIISGTWRLASPQLLKRAKVSGDDRTGDPRFFQLVQLIADTVYKHSVRYVIFEDVLFSKYTLQTQLWASLRAAVWSAKMHQPYFVTRCIDTSRLKKFGSGHGGATKEMMAAALLKKNPTRYQPPTKKYTKTSGVLLEHVGGAPMDDNEIDALHLLSFLIAHE